MADLKNFTDFLNYYKQTGKLPSGIDQPTMDAANSNAEMLGIPAETAQIPFALGQSPEPVAPIAEEAPIIEKTPAQQPVPKPAPQAAPMPSATPAPQMAAPQIASAVNPLDDKEMQAAQEAARHNKAMAMGLEAGRLVSQGLGSLGGGSPISLDASGSGMLLKNAAAPIEELATAREQQMKKMQLAEEAAKNDPKSPVSQAMREALAGMGVKLPENATYATMEKLAPQIMKNKEFQMRLQEMAMRRQELAATKQMAASSKMDEKERKGLTAVGAYRGEPDVSKLKQRLEQVSSVIANIGDVKKPWTDVEKQAVQQEINAFLKGGSPTDQDARHTYKSLEGEASQLMSKISGDPQAFNDPATKQRILNFVKPVYEHHKEYLDRRDARKLVAEGYNKWSEDTKNEAAYMYPDAVKMIESKQVISPYGKGHGEEKSSSKGTVDSSTLNKYAAQHNISPEKAKELLSKAGYNVQ